MKHIVIIGGGASGLVAAIYAKNDNNQVTILERNSSCGKKILVTGNGKCNYWNSDQSLKHYHSKNEEYLQYVITENNKREILSLFQQMGIYPKIKNGYYYPFSNQATTVKNALLSEVKRKNIMVRTDFLVKNISKENNVFKISGNNELITADKVIIATGSKAAPKTGSDGQGYQLLEKMGHTILSPLPALVQVKTSGNFLKDWAGVRSDVEVALYENDRFIKKEIGEIQLTDYGISGICVFNLSRYISIGLSRNKKEIIKINFLPFITENPLEYLIDFFCKATKKNLREQLCGFLNYKLVDVILKKLKLPQEKSFLELTKESQELLVEALTNFSLKITGTKDFEHAQVCSGGIPLTELNTETMESRIINNLYVVGELVDIDGDCGGYNLSFAWISGMLAGRSCNLDD